MPRSPCSAIFCRSPPATAPTRSRAIGTSALRDAEDGPEFCDRVRKELKLSIEVISAAEEARLAFLSVARAFDISGREVAVADIGGGSTEIVLASTGLVDQVYATKLGTVRVTEQCDVAGRSTPKAGRQAAASTSIAR